jgi:hypothetical protein
MRNGYEGVSVSYSGTGLLPVMSIANYGELVPVAVSGRESNERSEWVDSRPSFYFAR